MSISRITYVLLTITLLGFLLIYLKSFLIPLVFSLAIWFLIRKLRNSIIKVVKMPFWLGSSLASLVILIVLFGFSQLLTSQVKSFMVQENLDKYNENFKIIGDKIVAEVGYEALQNVFARIQDFNIADLISSVLGVLTNLVGNSFMVVLYLLFLLLEEKLFKSKLNAIYSDKTRREDVFSVIRQITKSIESYITLKTVVSAITGIASYIGLLILGIDFPVFWAILIFLLNYIPTIGSLIATIFPAVMALIQYQDDFSVFFYVLGIIGIIQLIVGNLLEPRIMGGSLNISPLVVILSLTLWGLIWGIVGMILSVPIMVILIIILSKIPSTRNIAIMMSSDGKV